MLDLAHINLGSSNVYAAALKRQAASEAKRQGFSSKDLIRAYNRFNIFWVIGQSLPHGVYRLVAKSGAPVEVRAQNDWQKMQVTP